MLTPYHVLVVDDNKDHRDLFSYLLREHGYDVSTAPDAASALAYLETRPVDLVLTDYVLPGGMMGDQLIMSIKHRQYPAKTVLISNQYQVVDIGRVCGADGYLRKSDFPQLPRLLASLLS